VGPLEVLDSLDLLDKLDLEDLMELLVVLVTLDPLEEMVHLDDLDQLENLVVKEEVLLASQVHLVHPDPLAPKDLPALLCLEPMSVLEVIMEDVNIIALTHTTATIVPAEMVTGSLTLTLRNSDALQGIG